MFDLITIGDALIDTFFVLDEKNVGCTLNQNKKKLCFNYANKMSIEHSTLSVGGNAANVAVGVRKLGLDVAIRTHLGDDINGHVVYDALETSGVDTSLVSVRPEDQTRYSVVLNFKSERTILSYHGKRKYTLPKLPNAKWLYYTSMGSGFEKVQNKILNYLKKHPECKLAMNPGSYQMKKGLIAIKRALPHVAVLLVNKEEGESIVGKRNSIGALINALHKTGPTVVVVTDSTRGSYASNGVNIYKMPAYPIKPMAKTGAGDAYTSGFLTATILGKTIPEAMQWGTANAGGVIKQFGAQKGLLSRSNINKIIKKYPNVKPRK